MFDTRLQGRDFVADSNFIVDMAIWPWTSRFEWRQIDLDAFPDVRDWYLRIADRPAAQREYDVPKVTMPIPRP